MLDRRILTFVVRTFGLALLLSCTFALADQQKSDPPHTSIIFRAKHLDTSYVYGRFNSASATITYDEADPTKFAIDATIQVASVDTGNAQRDAHLKKPDFFSAKEFPTIAFKSTAAKSAGANKFEVTGDLTLHGQTKPITITVEKTGSSTKMGARVGWLSTFTIKRSEFGMTFMLDGGVSDEIDLTVSLETLKS